MFLHFKMVVSCDLSLYSKSNLISINAMTKVTGRFLRCVVVMIQDQATRLRLKK